MSKVSNEQIKHLGDLAKLQFTESETENLKKDLEKMLDFVEELNEVNTDNVEPLIHMGTEVNRLRPDEAQKSISQKEALKNAPLKDSDFFKVPKVK